MTMMHITIVLPNKRGQFVSADKMVEAGNINLS